MLGVVITLAIGFLMACFVSTTRLPNRLKTILYLGIALRYLGAVGREQVAADAFVYFRWGTLYAKYFGELDFSPLYDPNLFRSQAWLGTNFVGYPVGLVITLIGESWLGTFFAFGLISFCGLLAFAVAFKRCYPLEFRPYWSWLFLIPSLWFWPSSIGKEALMLTGLGIATLGFAGKKGRINWLVLVVGLALVFCIRPQVAAVFVFSMAVSYTLNFDRLNSKNLAQALVVVGVGLLVVWYSLSTTLGTADVELEMLQEYVAEGQRRSGQGGSEIELVSSSPASVPLGIINVLFRPFPWEAHNLASLVAACEMLLIWSLIYWRRRELRMAMRMWRHDRMLRFAIPFALMYVIAFGMIVANLGIIARQRVLVFPFLFLIVEAGANYRRLFELQRARRLQAQRRPPVPAGAAF